MIRLAPTKRPLSCLLCQRPLSREAVNALRADPRLISACTLCAPHNPLCPDRRLLACRHCRAVRFMLVELEAQ